VNAPIYLGDEVSAAGYRLAGAQVRTPGRGEASAALAKARAEAPLVLVSATVAADIGAGALRPALAATEPLVLVVPDVNGTTRLPDVAARMREQLGLEA
jgi:vacuolar-type H+-ATPase subunit F/Vma7